MIKAQIACMLLMLTTACAMQQKPSNAPKKLTLEEILKKQVLLTNEADFTNNRSLMGASAFLIYYNDSIYAVTAKHLIGPDGGVEPAVPLTGLSNQLIRWKMHPRQPVQTATDTITATAKGLNYDASTSDALLLKTVAFKEGIQPLLPNFDTPAIGDTLYVIGCPYTEHDCKQNVYKMVFAGVGEQQLLVSEIFSAVEMSGFSGAPIVNTSGEVVGIITGSNELDGKHYVYATSIKQIKWIK